MLTGHIKIPLTITEKIVPKEIDHQKICSCGKMMDFFKKHINLYLFNQYGNIRKYHDYIKEFAIHTYCPYCGDKVYFFIINKKGFTDRHPLKKLKPALYDKYMSYINTTHIIDVIFISHKVIRYGQKGLKFYKSYKSKCIHVKNVKWNEAKEMGMIQLYPKMLLEYTNKFYCPYCGMKVVIKNNNVLTNYVKEKVLIDYNKNSYFLPNNIKGIYKKYKNKIYNEYIKDFLIFYKTKKPTNSLKEKNETFDIDLFLNILKKNPFKNEN